jgi:hypothetical protein
MNDTDKYEELTIDDWYKMNHHDWKDIVNEHNDLHAEVERLREDYEKMSEVLRGHGMDICRHCRVIYRDSSMDHPHYPSLHPWHMDGMCMKEAN